jgi:glycylpeptide N-tetradecanoyltransferase
MPPPNEEPKQAEPAVKEADEESKGKGKGKQAEVESEGEDDEGDEEPSAAAAGATTGDAPKKKKKKSKRKKIKDALTGQSSDPEAQIKKALGDLTPQQIQDLLALNPSLAESMSGGSGSGDQAASMLQKLNLQDIMTGLAAGGKNVKDMGDYKFWQTQPVPRFDDKEVEDGPLRVQKIEDISTEPSPMVPGFEWVTLDLHSDEEIKEVYELLNGHYVEDDEAMFRFNYSPSFLRW